MPRRALGPRLWLQPARPEKAESAVWVIRDGKLKRSTGCPECDVDEARRQLARYVLEKGATPRDRDRHPDKFPIAQALGLYATDKAAEQARPREVTARLRKLGEFFGSRTLGEVNGTLCRAYAAWRAKPVARRELEDLRAAFAHVYREGYVNALVPVVLPEKGRPRERWLTRSEAARLLWAAYRREGKHVARFILIGLYTGTRSAAICRASYRLSEEHGFIDLHRSVFYRRAAGDRETRKRQPPVPLPQRLRAHLQRWSDLQGGTGPVIEWRGRSVDSVRKAFKRAADVAGLEAVTPHVLRHTCCTWLMQKGVPLWEAAGFLGMSVEVLEATYGHHSPHHLSTARDAFTRKASEGDRKIVPIRRTG